MNNFTNDGKVCIAELDYDGRVFTGKATCHWTDKDMFSEKTGYSIAEKRAMIKIIKDKKKLTKKILKEFESLYNNLKNAKDFNEYGFMERKMRRKMYELKDEIQSYQEAIVMFQAELTATIKAKDKIYNKIRKLRTK